MKIKLTENIAELYELKLPSENEKIKCYVKKELMSLHPGFDEYSLWDYKLLKNESLILAVVIDSSFYMEKRIAERFSSFYVDYNGQKISYFNNNKYGANGKRKIPLEVLLVLILCLFLILSISVPIYIKSKRPVHSIMTVSSPMVMEKKSVPYVFDILNDIAELCNECKLEVSEVHYISVPNHRLTFSISNPNDENIANVLKELPYIRNVELSKTVYYENIPYLTVSVESEVPEIFMNNSAQNITEDIQKYLIEPMMEHNIQMRSFDYTNGTAILEFVLEKDNEMWFSDTLLSDIKKLHLLPVNFHFSINRERTECVVELKLVNFDIDQEWVFRAQKTSLKEILKLKEKRKTSQPIKTLYVETKPEETKVQEKLVKIGIVKEGDDYITFYHDENGKIVKRKE